MTYVNPHLGLNPSFSVAWLPAKIAISSRWLFVHHVLLKMNPP